MKITILLITLTLATITLCNAQKIEIKKVFGGYKYMQNEKPMSIRGLINAMEANADVTQLISKARTSTNFRRTIV